MPSMRSSGTWLSIKETPRRAAAGNFSRGDCPSRIRLLVFLALSHDLLRREIDAAGREGVADKEVVGLRRVIVLTVLEVGILGDRQRQLDRLRDHLALQRVDRRLDGDGDLSGPGAG